MQDTLVIYSLRKHNTRQKVTFNCVCERCCSFLPSLTGSAPKMAGLELRLLAESSVSTCLLTPLQLDCGICMMKQQA